MNIIFEGLITVFFLLSFHGALRHGQKSLVYLNIYVSMSSLYLPILNVQVVILGTALVEGIPVVIEQVMRVKRQPAHKKHYKKLH